MAIWLFENQNFHEAWVPFDRNNQRKLEYVFIHHDSLVRHLLEKTPLEELLPDNNTIDLDEQDPSAIDLVKLNKPDEGSDEDDDGHALSIMLKDSHFTEPITVYPHMLLGCLTDRDILVARTEHPGDIDKIVK
ncbi:predicted protein [Lichtheimia corymbifera JMRC:FSU:9682]|uniref:Uncharacterized protein n=1 Tax=Lichtheimia corymbifera JMRC:FSU:9682 TaxID=1263082 RepID=A0A068RKQ6_9FUNG|nr:predicted protein [Lichtheimia corymbifera JMRC:FSU:9682]